MIRALERLATAQKDAQMGFNNMVSSLGGARRLTAGMASDMERTARAARTIAAAMNVPGAPVPLLPPSQTGTALIPLPGQGDSMGNTPNFRRVENPADYRPNWTQSEPVPGTALIPYPGHLRMDGKWMGGNQTYGPWKPISNAPSGSPAANMAERGATIAAAARLPHWVGPLAAYEGVHSVAHFAASGFDQGAGYDQTFRGMSGDSVAAQNMGAIQAIARQSIKDMVIANRQFMRGQNFLTFAKSAGAAGMRMSDEGMLNMAHFIDVNPARVSTAIKSFEDLFLGNHTRMKDEDFAHFSNKKYGLIARNGQFVDQQTLAEDPIGWITKHISLLLRTHPEMIGYFQRMNVQDMLNKAIGAEGNIARQSAAARRTDAAKTLDILAKGPKAAQLAMDTSFERLEFTIGRITQGPFVKSINLLTQTFNGMADFAEKHPDDIRMFANDVYMLLNVVTGIGNIIGKVTYEIINCEAPDGTFRPGYFTVVVDDGTGTPYAGLLASVYAAIDAVKAEGVGFAVIGPIELLATVSMTVTVAAGTDTATVQTNIQTAITADIDAQMVGAGYAYSRLPVVAYNNAGVDIVSITNVFLNGEQSDLAAATKQVIRAGSVVVTVVEVGN